MNFMAPWYIPAIAAAAAIPPLVLLYFLKLRRQQMPIASTLLWKRAIEDLRVNSPFQRLRSNLLLFLQLLILIAAILALSEPTIPADRLFDKAIVLLIDHSASMSATEDGGDTRLVIAKREALKIIEEMGSDQKGMVVAFGSRANVLSPFTYDRKALQRAVESIQPTDTPGRLTEAIALAEAHSMPQGEGLGVSQDVAGSHIMLFTDGRLPDAANVVVQRGSIEIVRVGAVTDNVAVVDLDVRRNYEQPTQLTVLARVRNLGSQTVTRDLSLFVDGQLTDVRAIRDLQPVGPADRLGSITPSGIPDEGSEVIVPFDLVLETGAYVEVRLSGKDALPTDDRAYAVVTPPQAMSVLLVTPGNRFLAHLIGIMPTRQFDIWDPTKYEEAPDNELLEGGRCRYDVVVFDGHSTDRLPPANYFFFGGIPLIDDVQTSSPRAGEVFLDWDDTHPILQHTVVEGINVLAWSELKLPAEAVTLIEATNGPVLALLERGRNRYLISAFSIFDETRTHLNTDWVFKEEIVAFVYDALRYLAGNTNAGQVPSTPPGEAFTVTAADRQDKIEIKRPDGAKEEVPVGNLNLVIYGRTDRVGIYRTDSKLAGEDARAVNLLDENESFIAPNQEFRMAAGEVQTASGADYDRKPLWPILLAVLVGILFLEWFVYNKRVYI